MGGGQREKTVLCIDDDLSFLRLLRTSLELDGYRVITETDGLAALRLATTSAEIDAVVTDFHMPGCSGEKLCTGIRQAKPQLPIVIFTGSPATIPAWVRRSVDMLVDKGAGIPRVTAALQRLSA
jgi:CheY-like chemotaxis protein